MPPAISIIVPVFNTEDYLYDCLSSIQNQSFTNFEVLLVNDGSNDNSEYICREFSKRDSRFKFFSNNNMGVSKTRNFALNVVRGTYLTFVDSDDWIHPDFLKSLYWAAKVNDADIAFCNMYFWYPDEHKLIKKSNVESNDFPAQKLNSLIFSLKDGEKYGATDGYITNKIFDFSKIRHIRFDENFSSGEDEKFIYQCVPNIKKVTYINQPLYFYRQRESSLVHRSEFLLEFLATRRSLISESLTLDKDRRRIAVAAYAQGTISAVMSVISENIQDKRILTELTKHVRGVLSSLKEDPELIDLFNHYYYPRRRVLYLFYLPKPLLWHVLKLTSYVYNFLRK